ncbi:MAG: SpoIID/LytB domain-containing protein [Polyangiaceae bacterium]
MKRLALFVALLLGVVSVSACSGSGEGEEFERLQEAEVKVPSQPVCNITVTGTGTLDIENEYLPFVIACEASGAAGLETLKAQAIAARSVTYYEALGKGSICDGQGCQVMSCSRKPSALHYQAVKETAHQYLSHSGLVTYAFYVSGDANTSQPSCIGSPKGALEHYVTYNDGKSGASVQMTKLGYIPKSGSVFGQNRGCMSQNGAVCLENSGKSYMDILRFYYGSDIQVLTGQTCAGAPPPKQPEAESASQEPVPSSGALEPMTRDEIIGLAKSGMGYSYWWGGGRWDPSGPTYPGKCNGACLQPSCHDASPGGPEWGADCSGFVQQVWQAPRPNPVNRTAGPVRYSTQNFRYEEKDWFKLASRDELKRGDALVYRTKSGGHIVLFEKWLNSGKAMVYECASCKRGCLYRARSLGAKYVPIRRKLVNDEDNAPKGELETASCEEISGYAMDPAHPETSMNVVLMLDKPLDEQGTPLLSLDANHKRPDKCENGGDCFYGFIALPPAQLQDGIPHRIYAYTRGAGGPKLLGGSPRTLKCDPPSVGSCAHSPCVEGEALDSKCDTCASWICLEMPECCNSAWDSKCTERLATVPGRACAGLCAGGPSSCSHSECQAGDVPLTSTCSSCADAVCQRDKFCCTHKWDVICAREAEENAYCACN